MVKLLTLLYGEENPIIMIDSPVVLKTAVIKLQRIDSAFVDHLLTGDRLDTIHRSPIGINEDSNSSRKFTSTVEKNWNGRLGISETPTDYGEQNGGGIIMECKIERDTENDNNNWSRFDSGDRSVDNFVKYEVDHLKTESLVEDNSMTSSVESSNDESDSENIKSYRKQRNGRKKTRKSKYSIRSKAKQNSKDGKKLPFARHINEQHEVKQEEEIMGSSKRIEKSHSCRICGRVFAMASRLNRHERVHTTKRKSFECHICGMKILKQLKQHLLTHAEKDIKERSQKSRIGDKSCECELCGRVCRNSSSLKEHKYRVHGGQRFMCEYCPKTFRDGSSLKKHGITHTGETPYKCHFCSEAFGRPHSLKNHLRIHTGELPFQCEICEKRFRFRCNVNVHLKNHNDLSQGMEFKCETCGKTYPTSSSLLSHQKSHNIRIDDSFHCSICVKNFSSANFLAWHAKYNTKGNAKRNPKHCHCPKNIELSGVTFAAKHFLLHL